jgi:hypothetical protein
LHVGWRYLPPGTRRPLTPGRRQPSGLPFAKIFADWTKTLHVSLGEQTDELADAAA